MSKTMPGAAVDDAPVAGEGEAQVGLADAGGAVDHGERAGKEAAPRASRRASRKPVETRVVIGPDCNEGTRRGSALTSAPPGGSYVSGAMHRQFVWYPDGFPRGRRCSRAARTVRGPSALGGGPGERRADDPGALAAGPRRTTPRPRCRPLASKLAGSRRWWRSSATKARPRLARRPAMPISPKPVAPVRARRARSSNAFEHAALTARGRPHPDRAERAQRHRSAAVRRARPRHPARADPHQRARGHAQRRGVDLPRGGAERRPARSSASSSTQNDFVNVPFTRVHDPDQRRRAWLATSPRPARSCTWTTPTIRPRARRSDQPVASTSRSATGRSRCWWCRCGRRRARPSACSSSSTAGGTATAQLRLVGGRSSARRSPTPSAS